MKKVILSMILILSISAGFAQKKNVSIAKNKILSETPDFSGAREAIKPALTDPTTKDDAKTWYTAGLIGYKQNEALLTQQYTKGKLEDKDTQTKGEALLESYDYFLNAYKLDSLPDKKGKIKPKYQKDIKEKIKEYFTTQQNLFAYGAFLFEKNDYPGTIKTFETYLGIPKLPMMQTEKLSTTDSTYLIVKYYTAYACVQAGDSDKAIAYYKDMCDDGYEEVLVHQLLYEQYMNKKDTTDAITVLKKGFEKYPKEAWFLQNLINYYIYSSHPKEAIVYLDKAIESEPNMAQYRFVKGNLDESLGNTEDARKDFQKALELDPTLAEAHAGLGRLVFNNAVKMADAANDIKDNVKYNAAKKLADAEFAKSIPYFKKAVELNPKEIEYKRTLKNLYYRLKMDKEYEAIDKEMNE
ncbi:MAG: tetratricopeptide repeat protein [Paludibacter sp.]|nr:tetratricopeptide repeat protein [Paludibacter sp.]